MIAHADELTPRQRARSIGSADDAARRYLQVATMRRDLPVPALPDSGARPRAGGRLGRGAWPQRASRAACASGYRPRRLRPMRPDSLLIRGLGDDDGEGLSPIVDRSTSFERWSSKTSPYARAGSPTAEEVEALLGELEQAQVLAFASGMTAWSNVCVALLRHGSVLVIPDSGYYEVELLAAGPLAEFGVETRRYSPNDPDAFAEACVGARLALVETPSNPMMHVVDLERAIYAAHAGGAIVCCDNTVATPLITRPLDHGADISWQSATKSLSGHSDVLAGVISVRDPELHRRSSRRAGCSAACLRPILPGWCCAGYGRSRCVSSASAGARSSSRPARGASRRDAVHYPGLPAHPIHDVAARQMQAASVVC